MLRDVIQNYRTAAERLGALVSVYFGVRMFGAAVLLPPAALLLSVALRWSGKNAVADQDIVRFLLSPAGMAGGLAVVSLLIAAAALDIAVMAALLKSPKGLHAGQLTASWLAILPKLPALAQFAAHLILRVLLLALPFAAAAGAVAWFGMTEYDINYYLTWHPPVFLISAALIGLILTALAVLLLVRLSDWALALHLVVFEKTPAGLAFSESEKRMTGHRPALVRRLLIWLSVRFFAAALVGLGVSALASLLPDLPGANLARLATAAGMIGALGIVSAAVVAALANGALAGILNEFHRDTAPAGWQETFALGAGLSARWSIAVVTLVLLALAGLGWVQGARVIDGLRQSRSIEIIAHRGAAADRPENTMAAIVLAIEDEADWVEIDVQEDAEGTVVVAHDSDFMKAASEPAKVWEITAADRARIDIGSWFAPEYGTERIPTLREVLAEARERGGNVLIELKYYGHNTALEEKVAALVEEAGMTAHVAVMSLKLPVLKKMQAVRPDWRSGLLAARAIGDLTEIEGDFLALNTGQVTATMIRRAHDRGKEVYVWTVDDPTTMSRMISLGVDGLITNRPALARDVVAQWNTLDVQQRLALWLADVLRLDREGLTAGEDDA